MRYSFIRHHRSQFRVATLCRVLRVSPSGFYAWLGRAQSPRQQANQHLRERLKAVHKQSRGTYGRRRVHAQVQAQGEPCSVNRVARLMRQEGLQGRAPRRRRVVTTDSKHTLPVAPNRLAQGVEVTAPDQVWVSDITYLGTDEGWLYLATVMDLCSRRIVGWSMQDTVDRSLTLAALDMALKSRQPSAGLIHHSDRGSQYACHDYQARLAQHGMLGSMSRTGNPYDNAAQESFYGRFKNELPQDHWSTRAAAKREVFEHIEVFYNRQRLHSALGYQSPADFEEQYLRKAA